MVEEVLERIPVAYGSIAIVASMLFFYILNCVIIRTSSFAELSKNWKYRNIAVSWAHAAIAGIWNLIVSGRPFQIRGPNNLIVKSLLFVCAWGIEIVHDFFHYEFYWYCNELMGNLIEYYNVNIYVLVCVSTGYFLYDFIDVVVNCSFKSSWEIRLHHIVVSAAFLVNIFQCRFLGYNIVALLAEANSIFLHLRRLLQFFQVHSGHWSYRLVIFLNLFTFVSCRFLCIGWIAYALYAYYDFFSLLHMLLLAPSTFIMSCINAVLFWRLLSRDVLQSRPDKRCVSRSAINSRQLKNLSNDYLLNNNGKKLNGVVHQPYEHMD